MSFKVECQHCHAQFEAGTKLWHMYACRERAAKVLKDVVRPLDYEAEYGILSVRTKEY